MDWVTYLNKLMPGLQIGSGLHGLFGQDKPPPPPQTPAAPGISPQLQNMLLGRPPDAPPPIPPPGAPPPPAPGGLKTDQEVSGKAADAISKLHEEQAKRRDASNNAAEQISDALLKAQPVTADGQKQLGAIQQRIIDAVNNPSMSLDTPAGEKAYLTFLQGQLGDIRSLITSGSLSDKDAASTLAALTGLIPTDSSHSDPSADTSTTPDAASVPPDAVPSGTPTGLSDPNAGLGPDPSMPAPLDPSLMSGLSGLASAVPQMMSPLSGLGSMAGMPMSMIPPMSGMGGAAANPSTVPAATDTAVADKPHYAPDPAQQDSKPADQVTKQSESDPTPTAQPAAADTPAAGAPPPSAQVSLPDGSTATAANPAVAKAMTAYLKGEPLDAAFKDQGMTLPPPGTPVTTGAVDRSQVGCGTIGMFSDHYVVALSSSKAFLDGQVVPLAQVATGQGFQGFIDPTKLAPPVPAAALQ